MSSFVSDTELMSHLSVIHTTGWARHGADFRDVVVQADGQFKLRILAENQARLGGAFISSEPIKLNYNMSPVIEFYPENGMLEWRPLASFSQLSSEVQHGIKQYLVNQILTTNPDLATKMSEDMRGYAPNQSVGLSTNATMPRKIHVSTRMLDSSGYTFSRIGISPSNQFLCPGSNKPLNQIILHVEVTPEDFARIPKGLFADGNTTKTIPPATVVINHKGDLSFQFSGEGRFLKQQVIDEIIRDVKTGLRQQLISVNGPGATGRQLSRQLTVTPSSIDTSVHQPLSSLQVSARRFEAKEMLERRSQIDRYYRPKDKKHLDSVHLFAMLHTEDMKAEGTSGYLKGKSGNYVSCSSYHKGMRKEPLPIAKMSVSEKGELTIEFSHYGLDLTDEAKARFEQQVHYEMNLPYNKTNVATMEEQSTQQTFSSTSEMAKYKIGLYHPARLQGRPIQITESNQFHMDGYSPNRELYVQVAVAQSDYTEQAQRKGVAANNENFKFGKVLINNKGELSFKFGHDTAKLKNEVIVKIIRQVKERFHADIVRVNGIDRNSNDNNRELYITTVDDMFPSYGNTNGGYALSSVESSMGSFFVPDDTDLTSRPKENQNTAKRLNLHTILSLDDIKDSRRSYDWYFNQEMSLNQKSVTAVIAQITTTPSGKLNFDFSDSEDHLKVGAVERIKEQVYQQMDKPVPLTSQEKKSQVCFYDFVETYLQTRQSEAKFRGLADTFGRSLQSKLESGEIIDMAGVEAYAKGKPDSITNRVLTEMKSALEHKGPSVASDEAPTDDDTTGDSMHL